MDSKTNNKQGLSSYVGGNLSSFSSTPSIKSSATESPTKNNTITKIIKKDLYSESKTKTVSLSDYLYPVVFKNKREHCIISILI